MPTLSGFITLVQEDRFQLAGSDGRKQLFELSYRAPVEIEELQGFERSHRHVIVHYQPANSLIAAIADSVSPLDAEGEPTGPSR